MDDKRSFAVPLTTSAILLLLPVLYVGSYYAMLNPDPDPFAWRYRFGEHRTESFYRPMERLDHWLRYGADTPRSIDPIEPLEMGGVRVMGESDVEDPFAK